MCGIAGTYSDSVDASILQRTVEQMCASMVHRGPDDSGFHVSKGFAFGMRRLSVIDLKTGSQPIGNERRDIWVIQNGEIYNHPDLRDELLRAGHEFETNSDTEVIVHGYEEWGLEVLERLDGMFALAIWEQGARRLVLARDRFGKKPLYYWSTSGELAFGSQLRALLMDPRIDANLNTEALGTYFRLGHLLGSQTFVRNVLQIPPGSVLVHEKGQSTVSPYWQLHPTYDFRGSPEAATEEFQERFESAVQKRLLADVPVGIFLSGGLDSAAIAVACRSLGREDITAYTMSFGEGTYDESDQAAETARHLGVPHEILRVHLNNLGADSENIIESLDEPIADNSIVPSYYLSQAASAHITVALAGDGGDEVLAGYETYVADQYRRIYGLLPGFVQGSLGWLGARVPRGNDKVSMREKMSRFLSAASLPPIAAHMYWRRYWPEVDIQRLLPGVSPEAIDPDTTLADYASVCSEIDAFRGVDRMLYLDLQTWLPNDILHKADRASMAHSLEVRSPFLDRNLVEFLFSLPPEFKLRRRKTKILLRDMLRGKISQNVADTPKRGFNAPMGQWLRSDPLRTAVHDQLRRSASARMIGVDPDFVDQLLREHDAGRRNRANEIWPLYVLIVWAEKVLGGNRARVRLD